MSLDPRKMRKISESNNSSLLVTDDSHIGAHRSFLSKGFISPVPKKDDGEIQTFLRINTTIQAKTSNPPTVEKRGGAENAEGTA